METERITKGGERGAGGLINVGVVVGAMKAEREGICSTESSSGQWLRTHPGLV